MSEKETDWRNAMYALEKRVLILEQWRINMQDSMQSRNTAIPTWVAITVTGLLGLAGLAYQMFSSRPTP